MKKKISTTISEDGKHIKTKTKNSEHLAHAIFALELKLFGEVLLKKTIQNATIEEKKARLDYLKSECIKNNVDYKEVLSDRKN